MVVTKPAQRDLEQVNPKDRGRVLNALDGLVTGHQSLDLRKLAGRRNEWRLRVGDWRVLLERDPAAGVVWVMRVLHRRDAY